MPNIKVGNKVKIISIQYKDWTNRIGVVIAVGKEKVVSGDKSKVIKQYIVQFSKPYSWSYFSRKEINYANANDSTTKSI